MQLVRQEAALDAWPGRWCDLAGDLLCALDPEGLITRVNSVWNEVLGPHQEARRLSFLELTHPEDRPAACRALTDSSLEDSPAAFECRLENAGGEPRWIQWKTARSGNDLFLIGRDETERKEAEQAVSDAYQKLTFYMMNSPLAFVEWDRDLRVRYWSPEAERAFGWTADDALDRHPKEWDFLAEEDAADFLRVIRDLMSDTGDRPLGDRDSAYSRHHRPDGSSVLSEWYHAALRDADGQALSVFSLALDVTERKRVEGELLMIRKAVESASDAICIADLAGRVIHLNRAFTDLFGYSLTQINPEGMDALIPDMSIREESALVVTSGHSWKREAEVRDHAGSLIPVTMRADAIKDESGHPIGRITVLTDLRERRQAEKERIHQALHDSLTGLPNRKYFEQRLERAFARSKRTDCSIACLLIDLDNVKVINDSLGHDAGNALLRSVAERLQAAVRPEDMVARLGGDEFVILLEDIADYEQAVRAAERVAGRLKLGVTLAGRELIVTASTGIATSRVSHARADDILRDANVAMYQAKNGGKAAFVLFNPSMNVEATDRLEIEMDLRRALERGEMEVYFQPIIHLESNQLIEAEALLRWQHPQRGLVGPVRFIPIAEETGLILPLGEWVLEQSCARAREWQERYPSDPALTISVNLSIRQLQQEDIVNRVAAVLEKTGLSASCLKLEITESVMMGDAEATAAKLDGLKALGVRLAVDDFGTGYSSMAYLSRFPLDTLKIDRAFVQKIGDDGGGSAIIQAIIDLAKSLKLSITSEGIETEEQREFLRRLGSDRGQGYLFAKPLPLAAFEQMLAANRRRLEKQLPAEQFMRLAA